MTEITLTELCGPHCGTANGVTGHCSECHDRMLAAELTMEKHIKPDPIHADA